MVTPFNGPIPPSNLLDKIARGVSQAKGPIEWPHSLRATRVKLIELSRLRAKEKTAAEQQREIITEEPENALEEESNYSYIQDGLEKPVRVAAGARRPLYRQSSMDFMLNAVGTDIKNNEHLARYAIFHCAFFVLTPSLVSRAVFNALNARPPINPTNGQLAPIVVPLRLPPAPSHP